MTRKRGSVEQTSTTKLTHDRGNAADLVQVLDVQRTRRSNARDIRDLGADLIPIFKRDRTTCRMRDSREMEHRVRGAAKSHIERHTVMDGCSIDDIERFDILFY